MNKEAKSNLVPEVSQPEGTLSRLLHLLAKLGVRDCMLTSEFQLDPKTLRKARTRPLSSKCHRHYFDCLLRKAHQMMTIAAKDLDDKDSRKYRAIRRVMFSIMLQEHGIIKGQ